MKLNWLSLSCCGVVALLLISVSGKRARDDADADAEFDTDKLDQKVLSEILLHMNKSIEPCENFYEYACGNWKNEFATKADLYQQTIELLDHGVNLDYVRMLRKLRRQKLDLWHHTFVRKIVSYAEACRNINEYVPTVYLDILAKRENIIWPTLSRQRSSAQTASTNASQTMQWPRLLAIMRKYGMNGVLVEQLVLQDTDNSRLSLLDIDKPITRLDATEFNYTHFTILADYLGVSEKKNSATVKSLWRKIEEFEKQLDLLRSLGNDSSEAAERLKVKVYTLEMPWLEQYLGTLLEIDNFNATQFELSIQNLPYFEGLAKLIEELAHSSFYGEDFLNQYLMIKFVWHLFISGPDSFFSFDCAVHTRSLFPLAMEWLYANTIYNATRLPDSMQSTKTIFRNLLGEFRKQIDQNSNNFDAQVLRHFRQKIAKMQLKVGNYPQTPHAASTIDEFYDELTVNTNKFYKNHLDVLLFIERTHHRKLHTRYPRTQNSEDMLAFFELEDQSVAVSSSPFYLTWSNVVVVPLTLLQPPVFHNRYANVFKYSQLGFLLGHEILHGFDNSGIDFDKNGNVNAPESIKNNKRFDEQLSCVNQLDSPQVIDEKIADIAGIRLVYNYLFKNPTAGHLLNDDNDSELTAKEAALAKRLFFINFAQFFCGTDIPPDYDDDEHGSNRQRVFDALANFNEFARTFQCTLGSSMHPAEKCKLYR